MPDGSIKELSLIGGKYAANYIRVSTVKQSADGFSAADQADRLIHRCIKEGWAFRLFSDAGLSGGLAYLDNKVDLIAFQREAKAQRYREVFEAVFLSDHRGTYTAQQLAAMREYMEERCRHITTGGPMEAAENPLGASQAGEEAAEDSRMYRRRESRSVHYRPALSTLVNDLDSVHSLLITDLSRLSRSELLISHLAAHFTAPRRKLQVIGLLQDLDYLNRRGDDGKLIRGIFSWLDEVKLKEVLIGDMRGLLAMLNNGKPVGKIPSWFRRDAEGAAHLDDSSSSPVPVEKRMAPAIRRLVSLYMAEPQNADESNTFHSVAVALGREGYRSPAADKGKYWTWRTVADILRNPALGGLQQMFGLEWQVFPALLEPYDYWRLRERLKLHEAKKPQYAIRNPDGYLAQGLLRCHCGRMLGYWDKQGHAKYICRVETAQKEAERKAGTFKPHAVIPAHSVDEFFDTLMREYRPDVLALVDDAHGAKRHLDELKELERLAEERHQALYRAQQKKRSEAEAQVRMATGMDESDPDFISFVEKRLSTLTRQERKAQEDAFERARTKRALVEAMIPADKLEEETKDWESLPNLAKNKLLRSIYEAFVFVGEPPDEELRPLLRTSYPYPTPNIVLRTEMRGKQCRRTMPPVEEWIEAIQEHRQPHRPTQMRRDLHNLLSAAKGGDPFARAKLSHMEEGERHLNDLEAASEKTEMTQRPV